MFTSHRVYLASLFVFGGPVLAELGPAADWSAQLEIPGTVRMAVPPPEASRWAHLAWPKAIRAQDGTIVLAYLAGIFHGNHGGKSPAVSLSTDDGRTFSDPQILREFNPDEPLTSSGNLAIGTAEDGAVVLLAMGYNGNVANDIFGWRSNDSGRTWEVVDTSELGPNKTGSVCGTIVQLPGGRLMVMGHYRQGSTPFTTGIWQSVSADDGRTWGKPALVTNVNGGEPVLVRAGDRLLVFVRGRGPASTRQYVVVSDDFGITWQTELSSIIAVGENTHGFAHPFAMINPADPAEIISVVTERPLPGRTELWRGKVAQFDFKRDRTLLTYPAPGNSPNDDYGYTWLLPTADGARYLMFYYHGQKHGANAIWVAEFGL